MMMTMLFCLAALTATAQEKKGNAINEKFFDAKVSELVYRLNMSDEQKTKFVPIYRRYTEEMRALMTPRTKEKPAKPATDEERLARTKQRMERQQQAQSIRLKYLDEFATVLNAQQVTRFFEVEGKMQKKLMDRRMHPKGKDKMRQHAKGAKKNERRKS